MIYFHVLIDGVAYPRDFGSVGVGVGTDLAVLRDGAGSPRPSTAHAGAAVVRGAVVVPELFAVLVVAVPVDAPVAQRPGAPPRSHGGDGAVDLEAHVARGHAIVGYLAPAGEAHGVGTGGTGCKAGLA